jgi:hypothetical protein
MLSLLACPRKSLPQPSPSAEMAGLRRYHIPLRHLLGRVYIRVVCFAKPAKLQFYKTTKDEEMRGRKWHASSRFGPVTCENPSFAIKDQ